MKKQRLVVKVGSSLLVNADQYAPCFAFMHGLFKDIALLREKGFEVVLASSGAVALGLGVLGKESKDAGIQEKQAAAAAGQPMLLNAYAQVALEYGIKIAQVLVTVNDMECRERFVNAKNTVHRLLERGLLPVVNENDTVATEEIRVGDNDRLAAKIAQMIDAQELVILTCIDGLYDRNPTEPGARLVEQVDNVTQYLEVTTGTSSLGSGGMLTKMQAANMAQNVGCTTHIGQGTMEEPISGLLSGSRRHTECIAQPRPEPAWSVWLTDRLQMAGSLVLTDEAIREVCESGKPVSCHDLISLHGSFDKADVLHVFDEEGRERLRGLSNFSAHETMLVARNPEVDIEALLGYNVSPILINPTNMVVLEDRHVPWEAPEEEQVQSLIA